MPDGFDPHTELETIYTFKQSVMEMRKCSPIAEAKIKQIASLPLDHPAATPMEQLRACEMIMNRAWGKPHTNVHVTTDMMSRAQSRVVLQHNYRDDVQVPTIENET
jgi:hypothetical protein